MRRNTRIRNIQQLVEITSERDNDRLRFSKKKKINKQTEFFKNEFE